MANIFQYFFSYITRHYLNFLPDKTYLKLLYYINTGQKLRLDNPSTFQEKLQWLKLYYRKPEYTNMVDKAAVKDFVASKIGSEYIIPTLGTWDSFDEINFESLPNQFVLKTTHGGGSMGVIICTDKNKFNKHLAKRKLNQSMRCDIYKTHREWPYKDVPKRIIAEKYIESSNGDLTDYKIFCFNGEPKYIQVIQDRNTNETIDFFDTEWNHQEFYGLTPNVKKSSKPIAKPRDLKKMVDIARSLAENTVFLRVDLYQTINGILFGELTFYPASGSGTFTPTKWNEEFSRLIKLPL